MRHGVLSVYDTLLQIVLDTNSNILENDLMLATEMHLLSGFREATEGAAHDAAYSNFCYQLVSTTFDCEGDEAEFKKGGSHFSDGAMAFLVATCKSTRTSYKNDPLQRAIWHWRNELGGGESNPLYSLAKKFDEYHKASKTPNVDVVPSSNAGTITDGENLTVGPFTMSNYITASNFKVQGTFTYDTSSTSDTESDTTEPEVSDSTDVATLDKLEEEKIDTSLQKKFGNNHIGGIIEMYAVLTDGTTNSDPMLIFSGDSVPQPQDEFNISLPDSVLNQYDELYQIICRYQRVHACAAGEIYDGTQHRIDFYEKPNSTNTERNIDYNTDKIGHVNYQCTVCVRGVGAREGLNFDERSDAPATHYRYCKDLDWCKHGYEDKIHPTRQCGYTYEHEHTNWSSASSPGCYKTVYKEEVCQHGYTLGNCYNTIDCPDTDAFKLCKACGNATCKGHKGDLSCTLDEHKHKNPGCYQCGADGYCEHGHSSRKT